MPRIFIPPVPEYDGSLEVEKYQDTNADVYFVPSERQIEDNRIWSSDASKNRARLLHINVTNGYLKIFPINTSVSTRRNGFLKQKYSKIECITIEIPEYISATTNSLVPATADEVMELLQELPSPFTKDYTYGLGLANPYRYIVKAVETLSDCTEIIISGKPNAKTMQEGRSFILSKTDFEKMRLEIDKIDRHTHNAASSVKEAATYNILAEHLSMPAKTAKTGRHPYRKFFNAVAEGREPLSEDDQTEMLRAISDHAKDVADKHPEKLAKLQSDIDIITLENLIERFEAMLSDSKLKENSWQCFFNKNQFILNLVFGYPIIKVQDQASLGGRNLSGSGDTITDFLAKNRLTNNTAIIEIKTPQAKILNKKPFREGVYIPSSDLCGSINQALDQKYEFQKQIFYIKGNSDIDDIESYSVHCCLIIGRLPTSRDQLKSLEIFRHNSKDVEIITFDELLDKLKILHSFLTSDDDT